MSRGSGHYAPDGSPVELYARLAAGDEPRIIHEAVPAGATLLELGCGAGRITHPLVDLGHPVVAVDNSPEMLEYVRGAEKVLADIQSLELGRRFAGVVLASNLVNCVDAATRAAMLACCARHVADDGVVLVQRLAPDRALTIEEGAWTRGQARFHLTSLVRRGKIFAATMMYEMEGKRWLHSFEAEVLGDEATDAALAAAGLKRVAFLDETRAWVKAGLGAQAGT
ncbi:MAG TPA: class I SAM-dependent methyltransferase [Polyangiaceae bacterium]|jgi:SAM-dependent methyltransferase